MKLILLGLLLAALLLFPQLLAFVVGVAAAVASKPVTVAFAAGLIVRPYLRLPRRWMR